MFFGKHKPWSRGTRLVFALIFVIGMSASVSVATQGSALALTQCSTPAVGWLQLPYESAAYPTYNFTPHVTCTNIDAVYSSEIVSEGSAEESTDLYVSTNHDGNYAEVYAVGDYGCYVNNWIRCSKMSVATQLEYAYQGSGATFTSAHSYGCSSTSCPSSGPAVVSSPHVTFSGVAGGARDNCWLVAPVLTGPTVIGGYTFDTVYGWGVNICVNDQF